MISYLRKLADVLQVSLARWLQHDMYVYAAIAW